MTKIEERYLKKKAGVYQRQSTLEQVRENEGSRRYQEGQREHALRLGWSERDIVMIDDDLGLSGMTAKRPGYQRLLAMIRRGELGAVLISDVSRAGRDPVEWILFLRLLAAHDVLLIVDGRLVDPHDSAQVFVKQIEAIVAGRDNELRTENMHRGRIAKVRDRRAVSRPPVGYRAIYERSGDREVRTGRWRKDPDKRVRTAVASVFEVFRAVRSLVQTVRELKRRGLEIPAKRGSGVAWVAPTVARVRYLIRHPAFCGDYVYGMVNKRKSARRGSPS